MLVKSSLTDYCKNLPLQNVRKTNEMFSLSGSRFALMEAKLLVFFGKFTVEKCDKTPESLSYQPNMNNKIKETVYLNFNLKK
jgi:hypothetical protein